MTKKELVENLKTEILKSLLLEESDKEFWIKNAEKFPMMVLERIYKLLKEKNQLMAKYIQTAVKNNPETYVQELKDKIKNLKKNTMVIAEKEQTLDTDTFLANKLADL